MPKVTISNDKGLVQAAGNGLVVKSLASLNAGLSLGTETISTATACSTTIPVTILAHASNLGVTLGNGNTNGQIKIFISVTESTVTLTPTDGSSSNFGGNSATIATTESGACYILMWTNVGGWALISRTSGNNAGATAVAGMPVLAG